MNRFLKKMYDHSSDILNVWMEKLFPTRNQGCINFGYWKNIEKPLTTKKRIESQKRLYFELFDRLDAFHETILEVGSGRGHGVFWLREKGCHAFGIDILPSQIEKSKEQYPHLAPYFKVGKAEEIPFKDHSFDCVFSLEAAQHFSSFDKFCKESFRTLKKNGKLVVSTYFINSKKFTKELKKIIPDNVEGFHNAIVISDAIELMQANNFAVHVPPLSIGNEVFPHYSYWQKRKLGNTPVSALSKERTKWKSYYTGGGNKDHPWYPAFKNGWVDYYILEGVKINKAVLDA